MDLSSAVFELCLKHRTKNVLGKCIHNLWFGWKCRIHYFYSKVFCLQAFGKWSRRDSRDRWSVHLCCLLASLDSSTAACQRTLHLLKVLASIRKHLHLNQSHQNAFLLWITRQTDHPLQILSRFQSLPSVITRFPISVF